MNRRSFLALSTLSLAARPGWACIWDSETLEMENRRFPGIQDVITGRFYRHGKVFYKWRLQDRLGRLAREANNLALFDDIAVCHDKLGAPDLAVETMRRKNLLKPDLYETIANGGTFHIHAGRLQEGLALIQKAIRINPNAHFGREIWQARVVEYILERRAAGAVGLPLAEIGQLDLGEGADLAGSRPLALMTGRRFYTYLTDKKHLDPDQPSVVNAHATAIKGVAGMMFFGNHRSPELLECLADLLSEAPGRDQTADAENLAALALYKASREVREKDPDAARKYEEWARLRLFFSFPPDKFESGYATWTTRALGILREAAEWSDALEKREEGWIAAGRNPEEEFNRERARASTDAGTK